MKKIILCLVVLFSIHSYGYSYEDNHWKADKLVSYAQGESKEDSALNIIVLDITHCMGLIIDTHRMIGPERQYITREEYDDLRKGFLDLKSKQKLYYDSEISFKEVAEVAGVQLKEICGYADYVAGLHNKVVKKLFAEEAQSKKCEKK